MTDKLLLIIIVFQLLIWLQGNQASKTIGMKLKNLNRRTKEKLKGAWFKMPLWAKIAWIALVAFLWSYYDIHI